MHITELFIKNGEKQSPFFVWMIFYFRMNIDLKITILQTEWLFVNGKWTLFAMMIMFFAMVLCFAI